MGSDIEFASLAKRTPHPRGVINGIHTCPTKCALIAIAERSGRARVAASRCDEEDLAQLAARGVMRRDGVMHALQREGATRQRREHALGHEVHSGVEHAVQRAGGGLVGQPGLQPEALRGTRACTVWCACMRAGCQYW